MLATVRRTIEPRRIQAGPGDNMNTPQQEREKTLKTSQVEGLSPKNIMTVNQQERLYRYRLNWLARNPGAFVDQFIQVNWQEFERVWPPTLFAFSGAHEVLLPVPQKDRIPPAILQRNLARQQVKTQVFMPPVIPVLLQPVVPVLVQLVAPLQIVKPTSRHPQVRQRVILAGPHWKEIRLSREKEHILWTSGVVIPIQPIDSGSTVTVAAPLVIGRPVTEPVRGLFYSKPQAPTHILNLITFVLNGLANILSTIWYIQRRHIGNQCSY